MNKPTPFQQALEESNKSMREALSEYILNNIVLIQGPLTIQRYDTVGDKVILGISQFLEFCPKDKLEERLAELEKAGIIERQ